MVESGASYNVDPEGKFQDALNRASAVCDDLSPAFLAILASWERGNLALKTLSGPGKYIPLSKKYQKQKLKKWGFIYPALVASGALVDSISEPTSDNIHIRRIGKQVLEMGSGLPYAIYHQSGKPRKKIPFRPFLFIGTEQTAPQPESNMRLKSWITILDTFVRAKTKEHIGK